MKQKIELKICLGSSCFARGNKAILQEIRTFIATYKLEAELDFRGNHCFGKCMEGPNLSINGKLFHGISLENIDAILIENLLQ